MKAEINEKHGCTIWKKKCIAIALTDTSTAVWFTMYNISAVELYLQCSGEGTAETVYYGNTQTAQ